MDMRKMGPSKNFGQDESGATAIEYGLITALMVLVWVFAIAPIGPSLRDFFSDTAATLEQR